MHLVAATCPKQNKWQTALFALSTLPRAPSGNACFARAWPWTVWDLGIEREGSIWCKKQLLRVSKRVRPSVIETEWHPYFFLGKKCYQIWSCACCRWQPHAAVLERRESWGRSELSLLSSSDFQVAFYLNGCQLDPISFKFQLSCYEYRMMGTTMNLQLYGYMVASCYMLPEYSFILRLVTAIRAAGELMIDGHFVVLPSDHLKIDGKTKKEIIESWFCRIWFKTSWSCKINLLYNSL